MKTFLSMLILLSVTVFLCCSNDVSTEIAVIEEDAELVEVREGVLSSAYSQNITMKQFDENVVFVCTVENGCFFSYLLDTGERIFVQNTNVSSGISIPWLGFDLLTENTWLSHAFIEIVLKSEQNIIGYVVIEAGVTRKAVILKSVLFPQINGKYQSISEEYVKSEIEKVKAQVKR